MSSTPRILVVDDEPKIGLLLKRLLEQEGYDVAAFAGGAAAMDDILRLRPQLLVTDLRMPGMDGLELMRRARTVAPELPVVMITGYASMETAVAALRDGVDDYVTKPFSVAEIKAVVGRILQNRALTEENRRLLAELKVANAELLQHRERLTIRVREAETDLDLASAALAQRLRDLEVLREIGQLTSSVVREEDLLDLVTQLVRDKVGADAVAVMLPDPAGGKLVPRAARGPAAADAGSLPLEGSAAGRAFREGTLLNLPRAARDSRVAEGERLVLGGGALVLVPIRRGETEVRGVLGLGRTSGAFSTDDERLLSLIAHDLAVALENARLFAENEQAYIGILSALVVVMEARDPYLQDHSERVRAGAGRLARALGLSSRELDVLETGARLHDLGKVGIRDDILRKPGRLDPAEWRDMKRHPGIGDRIVKPLGKLAEAKPIIRGHHEHWDGSGYPDRLSGDGIPLLAQIVSVVDALDAMTSSRPYREALSRDEALAEIRAGAGTQFNPFLVEELLRLPEEDT